MSLAFFIGLLIFVGVYGYVCSPLLSAEESNPEEAPSHARLDALLAEKEGILLSIKDLELDHAFKKLSDEDFHHLYDAGFREGADVLKAIDLERERLTHADRPAVTELSASSPKSAKFCVDCGAPLVAQAKFCAQCGVRLAGPSVGETTR